jgi:hypothetical protein
MITVYFIICLMLSDFQRPDDVILSNKKENCVMTISGVYGT